MRVKVDKLKILSLAVVLLTALLAMVTMQLFSERSDSKTEANILNKLTLNDADKIKGYTCGILTTQKAEQFLDTPVSLSLTNYTLASSGDDQMTLRHYDSCKYESKTNSNIYAEFFVETYADDLAAAENFESHLPLVAKPEEKPDLIPDVDRIIYDAGVYYVLHDRQVIQVAASNGTPSDSEQFALELLRSLSSAL